MLRKLYLKLFFKPVVTLDNRNGVNPVIAKQAADICELLHSGIIVVATNKDSHLRVMRRVGKNVDNFWKVYYTLLHAR